MLYQENIEKQIANKVGIKIKKFEFPQYSIKDCHEKSFKM